ncbi:MAG: hypothetical protein ACLP8S_16645 [Solirubrobacteraceae bacterium]
MRLTSHDALAGTIRPTKAGYRPARPSPKPPNEQALLLEVWQISHFGWIPEAAIRRSLTIAGYQQLPASALAERLRQLLKRGWTEQRHSDTGTGESEWRLTDRGRNAVALANS